jgi:hypothetical protein
MAAVITKRTPIRPPGSKRITPAALSAFREMEQIKELGCDCEHDCRDNHCEKWRQLDRVLRHALKLPPWEYPTFGKQIAGHCDADCVARYHMLKAAADADEAAAKKAPA